MRVRVDDARGCRSRGGNSWQGKGGAGLEETAAIHGGHAFHLSSLEIDVDTDSSALA
jgi:hypothetical protein